MAASRTPTDGNPERRKNITLHATVGTIKPGFDILCKFSSIERLRRVIAYCHRFGYNTRNQTRDNGPLTVSELRKASKPILKLVQPEAFLDLYDNIKNPTILKPGKLLPLSPFLDKDEIIRVGGRLANADIPFKSKHPAVLPNKHHITDIIIRDSHIKHGHSGTQGTLCAVRQNFWPINGKAAVKKIIKQCITCHRLDSAVPQYPLGQLPKNRIIFTRPFLVAGVDYCGPFHIKKKKLRNTKTIKTYTAIFVCFSTKAVHIELVSDLTSDAFLAALKRSIARRGKCSDIYSDNTTTFAGAKNELDRTINTVTTDKQCHQFLTTNEIQWHFIPPRAPHFGRLWEAAVKSCKYHLIRTMGTRLFTFEELATCLIQIEAILNFRPLTPLSPDPNDLTPLTPGHFLIGDSLTSTPECDLTELKAGRLASWQHVQQIRHHFWKRWYKEYLNEITIRRKWHTGISDKISKGMLVILKEDNPPPFPASLAHETHHGTASRGGWHRTRRNHPNDNRRVQTQHKKNSPLTNNKSEPQSRTEH
ncbi:uncharacterized protein LOC143345645 [Colletes latitarsis]|uniref:uncharacterized protein LOC143345645 n=1 Tax=Colletes latitarsis TaxID=2605962 RepID=UPI004036FBF9